MARRVATHALLGALVVLLLVPTSSPASATQHHSVAPPFTALAAPGVTLLNLSLNDGQVLRTTVAGLALVLTDHVHVTTLTPTIRSYVINITSPAPNRALRVTLLTNPVAVWSGMHMFPFGPSALPPLHNWTWSISRGSTNVSQRWSATGNGLLTRTIAWANASFNVTGTSRLTESVAVYPGQVDGTVPTSPGFMMINPGANGSIPPGDSDFSTLVQPLSPQVIRVGLTTSANVTWNTSSQSAVFTLRSLGNLYNFSRSVGARLYLSLPAGSWGDGNTLPTGMPLNLSQVITFGPRTGYFPTVAAYGTYVRALVHAVHNAGMNITYWNIGNEVPTKNGPTVESAYTQLYNVASGIIHRQLPASLVGSDIMMQKSELDTFAATAHKVDFLSFHYYPDNVSCPNIQVYCIPNDANGYLRDASFWLGNHSLTGMHYLPPALAQLEWYNVTGQWIPTLDSESNFAKGMVMGTDPRGQNLLGGAWVGNTLIAASEQNVSEFTYFSLEGPTTTPNTTTGRYGGWGWGMTSEGLNDNDLRFAPYWAMNLWAQATPMGSVGIRTASSNSSTIVSFATKLGANISVYLVNRMDAQTTVRLSLPGGSQGPIAVQTLDSGSYQMSYVKSQHQVVLHSSSVASRQYSASDLLNVTIRGYGVALIQYDPSLPFAPSGATGLSNSSAAGALSGGSTGGSVVAVCGSAPLTLRAGVPGAGLGRPIDGPLLLLRGTSVEDSAGQR